VKIGSIVKAPENAIHINQSTKCETVSKVFMWQQQVYEAWAEETKPLKYSEFAYESDPLYVEIVAFRTSDGNITRKNSNMQIISIFWEMENRKGGPSVLQEMVIQPIH
jgi:hypothetical protein